ncbi:hypothetical protein DFA_07083 [Cavenderia fasciculata]|uniref:FAD/NAD(P)-binding domain-containing protein n=1 Tax=Cavenderia fasciculata TaxID=261658 RepID=F4PVF8_CACFS|nr:uncharacterized protein DFA_07083 [Cavenderia fasciculata]EGG19972.1 hypothetical protein DFA_07083 [Cavenderia fasciculata]|eukprot:XP_004366955.1 hypothetical protein DFA_07083 [Cavenderia fasciculata]
MKHLVIIGGGIAGITCLESYHYLKPNDKITLLSSSPLLKSIKQVNRLTKVLEEIQVEQVTIDEKIEKFTTNDDNNNITISISNVYKVDTVNQLIYSRSIDNNEEVESKIHYDYLCICTGAKPNIIPMKSN